MNLARQRRHRPVTPPGASCPCISCCPTGFRPHDAIWHRPASAPSCHRGSSLLLASVCIFPGSAAQSHCSSESASNARLENRRRSMFPLRCPQSSWPPLSASFMARSSATTALAFSLDAFLLSCAWIALRIFATSFALDFGTIENTLR